MHWIQQLPIWHEERLNDVDVSNETTTRDQQGNRELPLVDDAITVLQLIKDKNCDDKFLFLGKTQKYILTQEFNDNIKEACTNLNIPYKSSHKVRKWAVTESLRQGMDEVSMMYTYGWKNVDTINHIELHKLN